MVDVYSVSTQLTLRDGQLLKGLRALAAQLRTLDSEVMRLRNRLGELHTGLGTRTNLSAPNTGARALAQSLGAAETRATRLARALGAMPTASLIRAQRAVDSMVGRSMSAHGGSAMSDREILAARRRIDAMVAARPGSMRGRYGMPSVSLPPEALPGPWGPRGGAPGGRGRGFDHGPWGSGIFDRGFRHTMYDTMFIGDMVGKFMKPGMQLGHERFAAEMMGETADQRQAMESAAFRTARQVPNKSAVDLMRLQRELLPIVGAGLGPEVPKEQKADAALAKTIEHLPQAARMDTLLRSYLGEKAGDQAHRTSQFYQAMRAAEILGLRGEQIPPFVDQAAQAMIAGGGRLNMEQFRQFAAVSGAAGVVMDPKTLLTQLPEVMMEIGGARLGTMAATFMQSSAGRMTRRAISAQEEYGLLDPSKITMEKGRISKIQPGAFDTQFAPNSEFMRFHDPFKYMMNVLAPALQAKGIDPFSNDPQHRVPMIRALSHLFSDRKAQQFAEVMLLHARQMQNFQERAGKARLDYSRGLQVDPQLAFEAMGAGWHTLRSAITDSPGSVGLMMGLTNAMTFMADKMKQNPGASEGLMMGGAAAGGVLAAGVGIRGIMFALGGLAAIPGLGGLGAMLGSVAGGLAQVAAIYFGGKQALSTGNIPADESMISGADARVTLNWEEAKRRGGYVGWANRSGISDRTREHDEWGTGITGGAQGGVGVGAEVTGVVERLANVALTGEATFNGSINVNMGSLGSIIEQAVLKGIMRGAGSAAGGASHSSAHWSQGISKPSGT